MPDVSKPKKNRSARFYPGKFFRIMKKKTCARHIRYAQVIDEAIRWNA